MVQLFRTTAAVALSLGTVLASPAYHRLDARTLQARWTYDVCNNCSLYGVPAPDYGTFNVGPIGGYRGERTYDLCLGGPGVCSVKTKVTLDFVGLSLYFNFASWPTSYEYQDAKVFLAPMGVGYGPSFNPVPSDLTPQYTCTPNAAPDKGQTCSIPFSTLTGLSSSDPSVQFGGMCPLGSKEALDFYVAFSGTVKTPGGQTASFSQAYPCTNFVSGECTNYCTSCDYAEMSYRCTDCYVPCPSSSSTSASSTSTSSTSSTSSTPTTSSTSTTSPSTSSTSTSSTSSTSSTPTTSSTSTTSPSTRTTSTSTSSTPVPTVCGFGTAFGYRNERDSPTLNSQTPVPQGCNRWGWYTTPTLAQLQSGISGTLLVGAGGNNLQAATNVGDFTAIAGPTGGVTVTYALRAPYSLAEVHVDLACLPMDTCAPGQYTFGATFPSPGPPVYANPTPLQYPACPRGSVAYLTIHASVRVTQRSGPCGSPVAV